MAESSERLRRGIEKRRRVRKDGRWRTASPKLIDAVFGDGRQLVGIHCLIDPSPSYYVVRVDSGWDLSESDYPFRRSVLRDYLDQIKVSIAEQFGEYDGEQDYPWHKDSTGTKFSQPYFPTLRADYGVMWFPIDWPHGGSA